MRPSAKRRTAAPGAAFRFFLDSWVWVAYAFGALPDEVILQRDGPPRDAGPLMDEETCDPLSRAERRRWERLVRHLR